MCGRVHGSVSVSVYVRMCIHACITKHDTHTNTHIRYNTHTHSNAYAPIIVSISLALVLWARRSSARVEASLGLQEGTRSNTSLHRAHGRMLLTQRQGQTQTAQAETDSAVQSGGVWVGCYYKMVER